MSDSILNPGCLDQLAIRSEPLFEQLAKMGEDELYAEAFNARMMMPDPSGRVQFLGNDQRQLFVPYVDKLLARYDNPVIFDLGGGAGEIVDLSISKLKRASLYIGEPNRILLDQYQNRLKKHEHISLNGVFPGTAQELESGAGANWLSKVEAPQVILMIHMIYHLSDEELTKTLVKMYETLAPGGTIFLVVSDMRQATAGMAGMHYFTETKDPYADDLEKTWALRERLLVKGEIADEIQQKILGVRPVVETYQSASRLYGKTIEDIAVMCFTGEMGIVHRDTRRKLDMTLAHIAGNPTKFDLREVTDGPRAGMISSQQPQIITEIRKPK